MVEFAASMDQHAVPYLQCLKCTGLLALPYMHCYTCTALHALLYMHCSTCTALHALPYVRCLTCAALRALPYMRCLTCTALHALLYMHCLICTASYALPYQGYEPMPIVTPVKLFKGLTPGRMLITLLQLYFTIVNSTICMLTCYQAYCLIQS
jgi:hypothetical protein